jgi:hypothetical protein
MSHIIVRRHHHHHPHTLKGKENPQQRKRKSRISTYSAINREKENTNKINYSFGCSTESFTNNPK